MNPETLLEAWFGVDLDSASAVASRVAVWYVEDAAFDADLRARFGERPDRAASGELDAWRDEPRSLLALVIALDQLPRNLFRGSERSFAYDARALALAQHAVETGIDRSVHPVEAAFLYLPFEHAEDAASQARSVSLFRALEGRAPAGLEPQFASFTEYAERHKAVIDRFGRFPHRNELLGRPSTDTERSYLADGGETFAAAAEGED